MFESIADCRPRNWVSTKKMGLFSFLWNLINELLTVLHILFLPIKGNTQKERLESFYKLQANNYDEFRKKLLNGREELISNLEASGIWVDMGGGTGFNVEEMDRQGKLNKFEKVYIVDLSPSLLAKAQQKIQEKGWKNVFVVEADATVWYPPEHQVDVVTFSYSLTMIPDWFLAVENAIKFLKPGGIFGVVDFYVSRKYPGRDYFGNPLKYHMWAVRTFWQLWFGFDNVNLSPDHVPYVLSHFQQISLRELLAHVPYIPFLKVPYYIFIGRLSSNKKTI